MKVNFCQNTCTTILVAKKSMYVSFKYNRANNETDQSPLQAYEKDFQKDNENNKP